MTTIVITVKINEKLEPAQLDYLKSRMNIMLTEDFFKEVNDVTIDQNAQGKKFGGTSTMEVKK